MKPADPIHSPAYQQLRATLKALWKRINSPCVICGQATIDWDGEKNQPDSLELQHLISRKQCKAMGRLDLIIDPSNCAPSHHRCNRSAGANNARPTIGETSEDY